MSRSKLIATAGAMTLGLVLSTSAALAKTAPRVGSLECNVAPGVGAVITSSKALSCYFFRNSGAPPDHYVGTISRFGLALGATGPGHLDWIVFAPTGQATPGALAGVYGGVGASASVGRGVGANALIGGSHRTISLQPFSVQAQPGFDVAAGVTAMTLDYAPLRSAAPPPPRRHER